MRRKTVIFTALSLLALLTACNLLTPLVFLGEHKKKVSAEFDKLAGGRVAIAVWTPPETLFDYPFARFELATYVADKLAADMETNRVAIDLVDTRDVEDFLQAHPGADVNPRMVGEHFRADYVVYLEVLEFQIRDPEHPQFLRGRIQASVTVHDIKADPDMARRYELAQVKTLYPSSAPVQMSPTNAMMIRQQTYRMFAEQVARKFYEHTVDL